MARAHNAQAATLPARRRFTIHDYHRMGEAGIFHEDDRVELLDGEIVEMSPIGTRHTGGVNRLTALFTRRLGRRVVVSVQNPIILDDYSEPQPDLTILAARSDYYSSAHPRPPDVLLAIEPEQEVIVYCACPNEYSAAAVAKVLIQHGFTRVHPLLGGIDAWIAAGHPVERS